MTDPATRPLVWLPFDPEDLGEVPEGLRYEVVRPKPGAPLPASAGEVEFWVPVYSMAPVDPALVPQLTSLRVIQTLTAGVDNMRPHVREGMVLCNGRGVHDTSTAELALALTLASLRDLPGFVHAQDRGEWKPGYRQSLADKHVLIVGYGQIGAAIEARLLPFEVASVTRVARSAREGVHPIGELDALVPHADVIILIVPGTVETHHLVDADFLSRMKDGALLVNMARGSVVDTEALLAALESGRINAAIDVADPEPIPTGHPLWSAPRLLVSPHVGGATSAMWPRAHKLVREQLERFAAGEELVNQMTGAY